VSLTISTTQVRVALQLAVAVLRHAWAIRSATCIASAKTRVSIASGALQIVVLGDFISSLNTSRDPKQDWKNRFSSYTRFRLCLQCPGRHRRWLSGLDALQGRLDSKTGCRAKSLCGATGIGNLLMAKEPTAVADLRVPLKRPANARAGTGDRRAL
jgi:hypothetical protein